MLVLPRRESATLEDIEEEYSRLKCRHWTETARLIKIMLSFRLIPSLRLYFAERGAKHFGFGRSRAQQYLNALAIHDNLPDDLPHSDADTTLRPLLKLPTYKRDMVWRLVHRVAAEQEGAAAGLVTREVVERVIGCIREQDKNMDCFDNEDVCKLYRVYFSQETTEWYLDNNSIGNARYVLKHIHLDVASDATADARVQADAYIDKEQDGLDRERTKWALPEDHPRHGQPINALCNAPGGVSTSMRTDDNSNSLQGLFLERAIEEYENGNIENILLDTLSCRSRACLVRQNLRLPTLFFAQTYPVFQPSKGTNLPRTIMSR